MISYEEFLTETKKDEFEKDSGWDTLDEDEDLYTDEEFQQFEHEREEQIQKMVDAGQLPQGYPFGDGAIPGMPPVHPGQYGVPVPVMGPNGVPMVGSVPGQPAFVPQHPQFAGQQPPQFAGQQPPQFAGQQPPQYAQQPQFAGQQPPVGQQPQFAGQPPLGQQPPQPQGGGQPVPRRPAQPVQQNP